MPALLMVAALLASAPPARAQPRLAPEPELRAAFILNFARFTTWPEGTFTNATAPLIIAVAGRDPVADALEKLLRDQRVGGRPVHFVRFESGEAIGPCHVLFLGGSEQARVPELIEALRRRPVLTVSDLASFAARGGILGLVRREGRLQFEANPGAAELAGLRLSSRLLQLATIVKTQPPPPAP